MSGPGLVEWVVARRYHDGTDVLYTVWARDACSAARKAVPAGYPGHWEVVDTYAGFTVSRTEGRYAAVYVDYMEHG